MEKNRYIVFFSFLFMICTVMVLLTLVVERREEAFNDITENLGLLIVLENLTRNIR